jgi:Integrase core domain
MDGLARTFVLPAPRVPDGLTISPSPLRGTGGQRGAADLIPDNGIVERMNRTIKDATVKRYFYETHAELGAHLRDFVDADNFARRLKTLRGLTPYEFICKAWTSQPQRFTINPLRKIPGLNNGDVADMESEAMDLTLGPLRFC